MSETKETTTLPTKAEFKKLSECSTLGEAFKTREIQELIKHTAPDHIKPDSMLRAFMQAAGKQPLIYKCDMRQALGAFMSLSYLGLVPGTIMQEAHLIPFKSKRKAKNERGQFYKGPDGKWAMDEYYDLNVIIGYPGYIKLAYNSGYVKDLQTGLYMPGDEWREVMGTSKELVHIPNRHIDQSKQKPIAGYAVSTLDTGGIVYEVMPWGDVLKIRDRSQAYRRALRAFEDAKDKGWRIPETWTEAPWVRDELEMGRKTLVRRISKILPRSPQLMSAVAMEDAQDAGRNLDFGPVIDGTATPFDGIPEQEDQPEPDPVDPGTAHGDRRQPVRQTRQQPKKPDFEATLINHYGEVEGDHTDAARFASALVKLCEANPDNQAEILDQNADAVDACRALPAAWKLIEPLFNEPQGEDGGWTLSDGEEGGENGDGDEQGSALTFAAIDPPMNNGKPSWPVWMRLLRDDMASVHGNDLIAWLDVQRVRIEEAPMAQRAPAIKAIGEHFEAEKITPPEWAVALIPNKQAAPQLSQEEKDARWVEDRLGDIQQMTDTPDGRVQFDELIGSVMFRTVMARLQRENKPIFDRLNLALGAKSRSIKAAIAKAVGTPS